MNSSPPKIIVLLAAYNGEKYISEQLDSILNQENVNLSILVSIDKCKDRTNSIVNKYVLDYPKIISILPYGISYGSAGQNFVRLLTDADFSDYQYISFADQDDIWLPGKLNRAITEIEQKKVDAYSSNVTAFWDSGKTSLVKKDYPQVEFDYLFESPGPGCTFVLNKKLAISIQEHLLSKGEERKSLWMHDWYCYSFSRFNKFKWCIDSIPLMRYRQHSCNEVGANTGWNSFISRLKVILDGDGFSKVLKQASFIGQSEVFPIKLIQSKQRVSMFKLFLISWKCRRQFSHKLMLAVACLLFTIKGGAYSEKN